MNENGTVKDLESQARNTRQLMDRLNLAAYGMTFDEALKLRSLDHSRAAHDTTSNHDNPKEKGGSHGK